MKKLIIFDVGGTLTNLQKLFLDVDLQLLRKLDINVKEEKLQKTLLEINESWENSFPNFPSSSTRFFASELLRNFSLYSEERVENFVKEFQSSINWSDAVLFEDVHPVLSKLKSTSYHLATLANGNSLEIHSRVLESLSIGKYFDLNAYSATIGFEKPDVRAYQYVLKFFGVKPYEALMVGDSLGIDVYGANLVGITSVWLNRFSIKVGFKSSNKPNYEIHNLRELLKLSS